MLHDRTTLVLHIHVYKTQPTMTIIMLIHYLGLVSQSTPVPTDQCTDCHTALHNPYTQHGYTH